VGSIPASIHGGRARILYLWWNASPGAAADQPGVQDWYIPCNYFDVQIPEKYPENRPDRHFFRRLDFDPLEVPEGQAVNEGYIKSRRLRSTFKSGHFEGRFYGLNKSRESLDFRPDQSKSLSA
jgi:hypothetical protein